MYQIFFFSRIKRTKLTSTLPLLLNAPLCHLPLSSPMLHHSPPLHAPLCHSSPSCAPLGHSPLCALLYPLSPLHAPLLYLPSPSTPLFIFCCHVRYSTAHHHNMLPLVAHNTTCSVRHSLPLHAPFRLLPQLRFHPTTPCHHHDPHSATCHRSQRYLWWQWTKCITCGEKREEKGRTGRRKRNEGNRRFEID